MFTFLCKILVLACLPLMALAQPQTQEKEFHRLLAVDGQQRLLVVKIKNTEFWVTPGLYAAAGEEVDTKLKELAAEYSLTIDAPELRGNFTLINKEGKTLVRKFYVAQTTGVDATLPDNISELQWLSLDKATDLITFPHINILTRQVLENPDKVWGAEVRRFQEDEQYKAELSKSFYVIEDKHPGS